MKCLAFALVAILSGASLSAEVRPTISAGRITSAIHLDGLLNESEWATASAIHDLVMVEPNEGAKASRQTQTRILADPRQILIGITCEIANKEGVVSFSKQRDADLSKEDHIRIVVDPFQDGRSGYVFAINPSGARYDALVSQRGEEENSNWDGIWEVATHVSQSSWSLELRIPIQTLNFKKDSHTWYFNVQRRIQRKQETDRWAGAKQDYLITQTSQAGLLIDLPSFDLGMGLSIRPSIVGGGGIPSPDSSVEYSHEVSLDLTKRLSPNLLSSLTINTDFAETEVDQRQINLTRFPLFFPEKRTFFLEGADIFEFGLGLGEDVIPFFSRRIGLVEGQQVSIIAGIKLNGQIGHGTNVGALVVRTDAAEGIAPSANMGVVRVKQNLLGESSAGFIATAGDPNGVDGSWMGGADFTYQTSHFQGDKNFLVGIWGLTMDRDQLNGDKSSYGLKIDYPNDLWDVAFLYKRIGDSFEPSLGFVPRQGIHKLDFGGAYSPRPGRFGIRQMFHEFFVTYVTDLKGDWESYEVFAAPINWRMESGDRFEFNIIPAGERLNETFEIANGVILPPGEYQWNRYRLELATATKRRLSGVITWGFGDFFSGTLNRLVVQAVWNPQPLTTFESTIERNHGNLTQGEFHESLYSVRVKFNFSPDLQLSSLLQYDTESKSFGSNTRLRWTFHSVADLFVIYNHNLLETIDNRWIRQSNELLIKIQYTVRK